MVFVKMTMLGLGCNGDLDNLSCLCCGPSYGVFWSRAGGEWAAPWEHLVYPGQPRNRYRVREILCLEVLNHTVPPDWQLGRAN